MPNRHMTVSDSVVIAAEPLAIYARVSDPRQTRDWSPENTGARFDVPAADLAVGSTFVGTNKRGKMQWVTRCRVTDAHRAKCSRSGSSRSASARRA